MQASTSTLFDVNFDDYDDDDELFPTGLTPDLSWVDLNLPTGCPNDLDAFSALNCVFPDFTWSSTASPTSTSRSASSTPGPAPTTIPIACQSTPRNSPPGSSSTSSIPASAASDREGILEFIDCASGSSVLVSRSRQSPTLNPNPKFYPHPSSASPKPNTQASSPASPTTRITKRQSNTEAARRYRQRKVDQMNALQSELEAVKLERDQLRMRCSMLAGEKEGLKRLVDLGLGTSKP